MSIWGYRPDGSNPCRHVPKYREDGETRYITNSELARLYAYLDRADAEGLEHPTLTLANEDEMGRGAWRWQLRKPGSMRQLLTMKVGLPAMAEQSRDDILSVRLSGRPPEGEPSRKEKIRVMNESTGGTELERNGWL